MVDDIIIVSSLPSKGKPIRKVFPSIWALPVSGGDSNFESAGFPNIYCIFLYCGGGGTVVCQWKTCGIFRYLVRPHSQPAEEDKGREKKKNQGENL